MAKTVSASKPHILDDVQSGGLPLTKAATINYNDPSEESSMRNLATNIPQGNPLDNKSDLARARESNLMTEPMRRRNALYEQSMAEADKMVYGWRVFENPIQPYDFGNSMTDTGLYKPC